MLLKSLIISTNALLLLSINTAFVQAQITAHHPTSANCDLQAGGYAYRQAQLCCDPIARLLSDGDRNKPIGTLLCKGDYLNPKQGKLKVACYLNGKVLLLTGGRIDGSSNKCVKPSENKFSQCTTNKNRNCHNLKTSSTNTNIPQLINPYSRLILDGRPPISWSQVPQATSYTVVLSSQGKISWKRKVKTTTLTYPIQEPALKYGGVYKLNIIANYGRHPLKSSSNLLILLKVEQVQDLEDTIKQINSLELTPDQQARELDIAFISKKLLTQSINLLNQRINTGTKDPTLYRLLGDRYLQAGLPQKAKSKYLKAITLAQQVNKLKEIKIAQARLNLINDTTNW